MSTFPFLSLILGTFLILPQSYAGQCKKLVAYGNPEYPPYLWRSSEKSSLMSGANVEYLKLVAKETAIPIEVRYGGTWARVQEELRYGRVDLAAGVFLTKERQRYLEYFEPAFAQTRTVVWVRKQDNVVYKKWSDLVGLQGVTVINNSFGEEFDQYANRFLKINKVASLQQALDMLKNGRVRYLIYEEWPAKAYIARSKLSDLMPLQPEIANELLFLALSKQSPCNTPKVREKITQALKKLSKLNVMPDLLKTNAAQWK